MIKDKITEFYISQITLGPLHDINLLPRSVTESNISRGFNVVFGVAGGIALIVVAYGGLKFVLSQGSPQEVTKAKNTIIDGMIGLVVIITAGTIIGFVMAVLT